MEKIIFRLLLATLLGALIGLEREYKRKGAGLKTYSLVCLGSCLFTVLSFEWLSVFSPQAGINIDPTRIVQAIATGIGFIGAGIIFQQGEGVIGLTTAAGLWVTAAIGIAVGVGFYYLAIFSSILTVATLFIFAILEGKFLKTKQ